MKGASAISTLALVLASYVSYYWLQHVSWYQISTSARGVWDLVHLPQEEVEACARAYEYMIDSSNVADKSDTAVETEHVRAYYQVISRLLAIADIEKMYIPPQLDSKLGLYDNQKLVEKYVFSMLGPNIRRPDAVLLDMGCGRGRISQHATRETGAKIRGYNIDESQIQNAIDYANQTGMSSRLDFRVGDHHQPLPYSDNSFDGAYSFQAVWPFLKVDELDAVTQEMYRVLKPGASYSCSEYLLNPAFDYNDKEHMQLHKLFLPTLAATQSRYPAEVIASLERAGFATVESKPSKAPAWPLTDQKTDLFLAMRRVVQALTKIGLCPVWMELLVNNLLKGGVAWADAEKMKIADLNWRITVTKPF